MSLFDYSQIGKVQQNIDDILYLFAPQEGLNAVYYGKTRNGKTRSATADILELLKRGEIVYANWFIDFKGFDERTSFNHVLVKTFFGKSDFFYYSPENFHYIDPDGLITGKGDINIKYLNRLVGVHIFIDEGQWVLPSLEKGHTPENLAKMRLILHGGHYCRSLNIITQRATNISKNTRSQINIWYRCVKLFDSFGLMIFQRWAIEDMKDDMPVEFDSEGKPNGEIKNYFVNKKHDEVFKAYNTHGMRGRDSIDSIPDLAWIKLNRLERIRLLISHLLPSRKRVEGAIAPYTLGSVRDEEDVELEEEKPYRTISEVLEGMEEYAPYVEREPVISRKRWF